MNIVFRYALIRHCGFRRMVELVSTSVTNLILVFMGTGEIGETYLTGHWYLSVMTIVTFVFFR